MSIKRAVLDRFMDQVFAIVLVEPEEKEEMISVERLPAEADEGSWLLIDENGIITIDSEETEQVAERITDKLDMLKNRSQSSKFKK